MSASTFVLPIVNAGILIAVSVVGCAVIAPRVGPAADVVAYERALDECLKEGREARRIAVYETCAKEADIKYGRDAGK